MTPRGDEPLRAAQERLWIERVLKISLGMLIVLGVAVAATIAALIVLI